MNKTCTSQRIKVVTLFLLLLVSITASYELKTKTDEFTGKTGHFTDWVTITGKYATFRMSFKRHENVIMLDLKIVSVDQRYWAIRKGDILLLKLSNDEVLQLKAGKNTTSCTGCGAIGLTSSGVLGINPRYIVTVEQLKKIVAYPPKKLRIYKNGESFEDILKKRKIYKLVEIAELILMEN